MVLYMVLISLFFREISPVHNNIPSLEMCPLFQVVIHVKNIVYKVIGCFSTGL